MTGRPIEELVVDYDLERVAQKADQRRRLFRSRMISLAISVVVVIGLSLWLRSIGQPAGVWVSAILIVVGAAWAAVYYVGYRRARAELGELRPGTAVRIGRNGVQLAGLSASWAEVTQLSTTKGGLGRSPRLQLRRADGQEASLALDQVSVPPATLDTAARAFSGGRHGVDLGALEL